MKIKFQFSGVIWKYYGKGSWYFVSLPIELSEEIRLSAKWQEEGWGRLKTRANINEIEWDTSIWLNKKANAYLLPLKADVRRQLKLENGDKVDVSLKI